MPAPLLSVVPRPLMTSDEMSAHVDSILRNFPTHERWEVAVELIDRAQRRERISDATARVVAAKFLELYGLAESEL